MRSRGLILVAFALTNSLAYGQEEKVTKKGEKPEEKVERKVEGKEMSWHGYVVDAMCAQNMLKRGNAMEKAAKHTRGCALEEGCAASGFGVFDMDGTWHAFDDEGDKKAQALLENSKTEKGIMVDVKGTQDGDNIVVASITESHMSKKEMMKKADSKPDHKH
jgi:hypothetical protein